jgi:hypothetical protein
MKEYWIYLDYFLDGLFEEMEKIQDGTECHKVMISAVTKRAAAEKWARRLVPFIEKELKLREEEEE